MNRFTDSSRRSRPGQGRRRAVSTAVGVLLIAVGAILRFAVTAGSPRVLHVHDVGVILILAGVAVMLLPGSSGGGLRSGWLRTRWISPGQAQPYPETAGPAADGFDEGQAAAADTPDFEFDPPPEAPAGESTGPR